MILGNNIYASVESEQYDGYELVNIAKTLADTYPLVHRYKIKSKGKTRYVNDPIPELKEPLKIFNQALTSYYEQQLSLKGLTQVAQAYLPHKSIITNADIHKHSNIIIKFDFSKFYDHVRFDYILDDLQNLDPRLSDKQVQEWVKRCIIDEKTKGVTQGLPVSGALAGLALIPFWQKLQELLPDAIQFTQYSDDLTFSLVDNQTSPHFNKKDLTQYIKDAMKKSNRRFKLNAKKTSIQSGHFRKITGVRINENNQRTLSRKDYRWLRGFLHNLTILDNLDDALQYYDLESKMVLNGKINYWLYIDETKKVQNLLLSYKNICKNYSIAPSLFK